MRLQSQSYLIRPLTVLITGAAGNLGSSLARALMDGPHRLKLLVHVRSLPLDLGGAPNVSVYRGDLAQPDTLVEACRGVDCIVHCAGLLFSPRPENFLPTTNMEYVQNLVAVAMEARVGKFILVSFPHVEGESTPDQPASGRLDGNPTSVHARTRLAAERHLFETCAGQRMIPVSLRAGMIYARGLKMIEAAHLAGAAPPARGLAQTDLDPPVGAARFPPLRSGTDRRRSGAWHLRPRGRGATHASGIPTTGAILSPGDSQRGVSRWPAGAAKRRQPFWKRRPP